MKAVIQRQFRRVRRIAGLCAVVVRGLWSYGMLSRKGRLSRRQRVVWLSQVCAGGLRAMQIELSVTGSLPADGLLVSNHLSYLDILVLSTTVPCAFVSKSEIQQWPIIGPFATWAGTVFVERQKKGDAAQKNTALMESLQSGVPIVLFPEGKTTDGDHVLRFHSTMLQPAIDSGATITPCAISYALEEGSVAQEVCYWGDMTLLTHGLNLLGKKVICAEVAFGEPTVAMGERKGLAHLLHDRVAHLYATAETARPNRSHDLAAPVEG
jgi:1-acyl-sn-glycerol-3-phosphate acyltransferase